MDGSTPPTDTLNPASLPTVPPTGQAPLLGHGAGTIGHHPRHPQTRAFPVDTRPTPLRDRGRHPVGLARRTPSMACKRTICLAPSQAGALCTAVPARAILWISTGSPQCHARSIMPAVMFRPTGPRCPASHASRSCSARLPPGTRGIVSAPATPGKHRQGARLASTITPPVFRQRQRSPRGHRSRLMVGDRHAGVVGTPSTALVIKTCGADLGVPRGTPGSVIVGSPSAPCSG